MEAVQLTGQRRWARGRVHTVPVILWSPGLWRDNGAGTETLDLYVVSNRLDDSTDAAALVD